MSLMCDICRVPLSSEKVRLDHLAGKKHQMAVHEAFLAEEKIKCGVFIRGFPNAVTRQAIEEFLKQFGKLKDIFIGDKNSYVIAQYHDQETAAALIKKPPEFMSRQLVVKPRDENEKLKLNHKHIQERDDNKSNDVLVEVLKEGQSFQTQVDILIGTMCSPQADFKAYDRLVYDILQAILPFFPGCTVHPFGSTVTGLALKNSDVDVYVAVPPILLPNDLNETPDVWCVKKTHNLLRKCKNFRNVIAIPKAKTPIVRCIHSSTKVNCDINFKNTLGVCNSQLIHYYLNLHSTFKEAMLILKCWGKMHEFTGSNGKISNYALTMMFIFYLQVKDLVPPAQFLQREQQFIHISGLWNGGFNGTRHFCARKVLNIPLKSLLEGFFSYYAKFNYAMDVICPSTGSPVPRSSFKTGSLPFDLQYYKSNIAHFNLPPLNVDTPMCVQDPFEQNHNVTRVVNERYLNEFIDYCNIGVKITKENSEVIRKLMFEEPNMKTISCSNGQVQLKLPLNPVFVTLEKHVNLSRTEVIFKWFSAVADFVNKVMKRVFLFDISESIDIDSKESEPELRQDRKQMKLDGQTDVHDDVIVIEDNDEPSTSNEDTKQMKYETITFTCSGRYNVWEARNSIRKDLTIPDDMKTFFAREEFITNYIHKLLSAGITLDVEILKVDIRLELFKDSGTVLVLIEKVSEKKKGLFTNFATMCSSKLAGWFNEYLKEQCIST